MSRAAALTQKKALSILSNPGSDGWRSRLLQPRSYSINYGAYFAVSLGRAIRHGPTGFQKLNGLAKHFCDGLLGNRHDLVDLIGGDAKWWCKADDVALRHGARNHIAFGHRC